MLQNDAFPVSDLRRHPSTSPTLESLPSLFCSELHHLLEQDVDKSSRLRQSPATTGRLAIRSWLTLTVSAWVYTDAAREPSSTSLGLMVTSTIGE
ncbi:hypothetical protein PHYPSEUDO_005609 [Phytophthora pseudosyringae]|uniref:Uncharacterized protein n=1 Tax=Phytophthora pseudosyringae TaxID=221518 RepID=A0A8T1VLM2_9STRA|nr:hypothetical protein PHYPSEUDO_005609 [Phytophthora pseudosyringae]